MSTSNQILEHLKDKGPEFVVNVRTLRHIPAARKTINKALERLVVSGQLERISRGNYRLMGQADPTKVAQSYARLNGIKLAPLGGMAYKVLGLEAPSNVLRNTFGAARERSGLVINKTYYNIVRSKYWERMLNNRIGAAIKLLELEKRNLTLALPLVKSVLSTYEFGKMLYLLSRYGSSELLNEPFLRRVMETNKNSKKKNQKHSTRHASAS